MGMYVGVYVGVCLWYEVSVSICSIENRSASFAPPPSERHKFRQGAACRRPTKNGRPLEGCKS